MKYNMTQLRAAKNAQGRVVKHLEAAGVRGPILVDARNKYTMLILMTRTEWYNRHAEKLQREIKAGKMQPFYNVPQSIEEAL
jgi:hypothetical protein